MTRRIKVIHVADKFSKDGASVHGVTRLFSWWFPRFDNSRFDVRLVGLRGADAASDFLTRKGVDVISLGKGKFSPATLTALSKLIRAERPDILHLHGYGASTFGRLAGRMARVPTIVHEHMAGVSVPLYQRPADAVLGRWTDLGIAVSEDVKRFMAVQRFIPASRIRVIINGAPLEEFSPAPAQAVDAERQRLGLTPGMPVLAVIGRLSEEKGPEDFLEALAILRARGVRVTAVLAGDGPLQQPLERAWKSPGQNSGLVFTGHHSDVRLVQGLATIQVFPSRREGIPLSVFEAMAMGMTIVSTTAGGLGEVLRHESNAMLVPPRAPTALADAIATVLADPATAQRLGRQALVDSRGYDIQKTVERMQAAYEELADPGQGRAA